MLVVLIIIGILAATIAPGWTAFLTNRRLNLAQEQVYQAMRDAQSNARLRHVPWQASFRTNAGNVVQWAIHPVAISPVHAIWNNLDANVQLDNETTLQKADDVRRVRFSDRGWLAGQLGRLTLSSKLSSKNKRCVIVSTLLGAMRKGQDQPKPQDGKFCQ